MTEIEKIYTYVSENKELLKRYKKCICLYCGRTFDFAEITEWVNDRNEKSAICPFCSVDAVVPLEVNNKVDHFKVTREIQEQIKNTYLGG